MAPKQIVFCSIGDVSIPHWLKQKKGFDVCLIFYGSSKRKEAALRKYATFFVKNEGYKMRNYKLALEKYNMLDAYDAFLFLDDDLVVSAKTISTCFKRLQEYTLDACQPSIVTNSKVGWKTLRRKPNVFMEYTNFIECNFMCLSRDLLTKTMPHLDMFSVGYGSDLILHKLVDREDAIAVFHDMWFFHPTRIMIKDNSVGGAMGRQEKQLSAKKIKEAFGIELYDFTFKTYKSIPQTKKWRRYFCTIEAYLWRAYDYPLFLVWRFFHIRKKLISTVRN